MGWKPLVCNYEIISSLSLMHQSERKPRAAAGQDVRVSKRLGAAFPSESLAGLFLCCCFLLLQAYPAVEVSPEHPMKIFLLS